MSFIQPPPENQRERERDRDRETERQREIQRQRDRDRDWERDRKNVHACTYVDMHVLQEFLLWGEVKKKIYLVFVKSQPENQRCYRIHPGQWTNLLGSVTERWGITGRTVQHPHWKVFIQYRLWLSHSHRDEAIFCQLSPDNTLLTPSRTPRPHVKMTTRKRLESLVKI